MQNHARNKINLLCDDRQSSYERFYAQALSKTQKGWKLKNFHFLNDSEKGDLPRTLRMQGPSIPEIKVSETYNSKHNLIALALL